MYKKRLLICLVEGLVAGANRLAARQVLVRAPDETWDVVAHSVVNRILSGFAIALSGWRINRLALGAAVGYGNYTEGRRWLYAGLTLDQIVHEIKRGDDLHEINLTNSLAGYILGWASSGPGRVHV